MSWDGIKYVIPITIPSRNYPFIQDEDRWGGGVNGKPRHTIPSNADADLCIWRPRPASALGLGWRGVDETEYEDYPALFWAAFKLHATLPRLPTRSGRRPPRPSSNRMLEYRPGVVRQRLSARESVWRVGVGVTTPRLSAYGCSPGHGWDDP